MRFGAVPSWKSTVESVGLASDLIGNGSFELTVSVSTDRGDVASWWYSCLFICFRNAHISLDRAVQVYLVNLEDEP